MKQITLLILNTLSLLYALIMNGLAGSPVFNGKSVGSVSAQYDTLFAPAGYAFAIWGLIYLLLICYRNTCEKRPGSCMGIDCHFRGTALFTH